MRRSSSSTGLARSTTPQYQPVSSATPGRRVLVSLPRCEVVRSGERVEGDGLVRLRPRSAPPLRPRLGVVGLRRGLRSGLGLRRGSARARARPRPPPRRRAPSASARPARRRPGVARRRAAPAARRPAPAARRRPAAARAAAALLAADRRQVVGVEHARAAGREHRRAAPRRRRSSSSARPPPGTSPAATGVGLLLAVSRGSSRRGMSRPQISRPWYSVPGRSSSVQPGAPYHVGAAGQGISRPPTCTVETAGISPRSSARALAGQTRTAVMVPSGRTRSMSSVASPCSCVKKHSAGRSRSGRLGGVRPAIEGLGALHVPLDLVELAGRGAQLARGGQLRDRAPQGHELAAGRLVVLLQVDVVAAALRHRPHELGVAPRQPLQALEVEVARGADGAAAPPLAPVARARAQPGQRGTATSATTAAAARTATSAGRRRRRRWRRPPPPRAAALGVRAALAGRGGRLARRHQLAGEGLSSATGSAAAADWLTVVTAAVTCVGRVLRRGRAELLDDDDDRDLRVAELLDDGLAVSCAVDVPAAGSDRMTKRQPRFSGCRARVRSTATSGFGTPPAARTRAGPAGSRSRPSR